MTTFRLICQTALPLLLLAQPAMALAQENAPAGDASSPIEFSADQLAYEESVETVTALGDVRVSREGYHLRADSVSWNRVSGEVAASGNVRLISPGGDTAYADSVVLEDNLRDGVVENMLLILEDESRLAAARARRDDGITTLEQAAYTPCAVTDAHGCPREPTWSIAAVRVVHDQRRRRISYRGARLNFLGLPIIALPGLSHPDGSGEGGSGFLVPDLRFTRSNGLELSLPYYWRLSPNRDLAVTPHLYTEVLPMLEMEYRQVSGLGALRLAGFVTSGSPRLTGPPGAPPVLGERRLRAYLEGNGRFQLDPNWRLTAAGRYTSDRTFLRRYDISRDDRLRSFVDVERLANNSYISVAGWAFQGLRPTDRNGQQPILLPAIDARWRLDDMAGGHIELRANSLALFRTEGQDTQRAFASVRYERRDLTPLGQELVLTAFVRTDLYNASDVLLNPVPAYRGEEGWNGRFIAAAAADLRWPLIGSLFDGFQRLTPRIQLVASHASANLDIPNEDARAVELEDSSLFALNRFPGYDRWEEGVRLTYGADWALDRRGLSIRTNIGQSYRIDQDTPLVPPGTGLSDRFSDFVGRTTLRVGRRISLVHRFRLDKDNLAIRRNEIDATVGSRRTYATAGYLRLDRDITPSFEDLRDREEVRFGGRLQFARYWSIFGSAVVDLTSHREDPLSLSDGFAPVRHRLGILYDDDCIELGVTWRRDYEATGDARRGNTFLIRVALRNLGR
ncbi:MAG: LPS-assembly protein LptD [Sphingosinicella sp.]